MLLEKTFALEQQCFVIQMDDEVPFTLQELLLSSVRLGCSVSND